MAQTKKKRQRKRRGTQGGRVDANRRAARPRSRAEAQARARQTTAKRGPKVDSPPTWAGSAVRGLAAAAIFGVLLLVIFQRSIGSALALSAFMLVFYIPAGYYLDTMMWRRRERARIRSGRQ